MIRAGKLRHRIQIMQPPTGRDAVGAPAEIAGTPVLFAEVWAEVNTNPGRERWTDEHVTNNYDAIVTIRYRDGIKENMFFTWKGKTYDIKSSMEPYGMGDELKLMCTNHAGN